MNRWIVLPGVLVLAMNVAPSAPAQSPAASFEIEIENTLALERPDEVIALPWSEVAARLSDAAPGNVRVLDAASGREVPMQAVDADADGRVDELLFMASLWPDEIRRFRLEATSPSTEFPSRAHVAHIPDRDDVAWESDRIAYRTYGQGLWALEDLVSSGVDVWTKRVDDLVIDRWYALEDSDYHTDTGEGADFFSVGPTLGNGGNAVWSGGALHRPSNFAGYQIVADGPIRAIFELDYDSWQVGDRSVTQTRRISIDAGQNLYREELTFHSEDSAPIEYAVGFVKRPEGLVGATRRHSDHGWLSVWGAFGRQSGGHGDLGGAVVVAADRIQDVRELDDHFVVLSRTLPDQTQSHYVGAGWTASGQFTSVEDWWNHLDVMTQRISFPVTITFVN